MGLRSGELPGQFNTFNLFLENRIHVVKRKAWVKIQSEYSSNIRKLTSDVWNEFSSNYVNAFS